MKLLNLIAIFALLFTSVIISQDKIQKSHTDEKLECRNCHSCEIPTKENPCLLSCPREKLATVRQKPEEGPEKITINKFEKTEDLYNPVKFSHRLHSEMSEMSGGCVTCHHYNPPGKIVACTDCHNPSRKREDINRPDLKGAYHRQCMDCHREWSGSVECEGCHTLKSKKQVNLVAENKPTKTHPKIETPEKISYKTPKTKGILVTFFHKEHIDLFGLECQNCHSNEGCVKCHDKRPENLKKELAKNKNEHKNCSKCHDTENNCASCHIDKEAESFNHFKSTGFDITKNHSKLSCQRCHVKKSSFKGLSKNCNTCHGNWTSENFNHKVTGILLDDNHIDLDCTDCHSNSDYSKPKCDACHDDKCFPKDLPGKKVK